MSTRSKNELEGKLGPENTNIRRNMKIGASKLVIFSTCIILLQLPSLQSNPIHSQDRHRSHVGAAFVSSLVSTTGPLRTGLQNAANSKNLHTKHAHSAISSLRPTNGGVGRPLYVPPQGRCARSGVFSRTVMQSSAMFGAETMDVGKGDKAIIVGVDVKKDKCVSSSGIVCFAKQCMHVCCTHCGRN
jgi:hypothetical protein